MKGTIMEKSIEIFAGIIIALIISGLTFRHLARRMRDACSP